MLANDVEHLFMCLISHMHILTGKISLCVFYLVSNWNFFLNDKYT